MQTVENLKEIIETQSMLAMAGFDLQGFMDTVVQRMQIITPATGAVVELVDGDDMIYKAACGSVAPYVGLRLPRGNSMSGLSVKDAELKVCIDSSNDPRVNYEACMRVGAVSMVCVPLVRAGSAVGVLKVVSTDIDAFSAQDIATLQLMAGLLGNALGQQLEMENRKKLEEALRARTQELEVTLAELEEQRRELEQRNEQVQEATRLKSEFLANMSHEIRTPMNAVVGFTDILLRSTTDVKHRDYLNLIREAGRALISLIGDILDFSKIEAGKLSIEYITFDPVQLVEGTAELLVGQCQSKGMALLTYIDPTIPRALTGDPGRIRQILINLVGNAIKFSTTGSIVVKVTLESFADSNAFLKYTITDQGMGMSEEEMAKLFRPFVQADGSTTRKFGGTGLGLSICKRLVELMGGEIGVTSTKGKGSTFTFSLPFKGVQAEAVDQGKQVDLSSKNVLIVDDDPISREIIASYLAAWDVRFTSLASSVEALAILRREEQRFDVVLTDLVMPEMDGLELAKAIQKDEKIAPVPVLLMMTALDQTGQGEAAVKEGFRGYLRKPIKQSQLLEVVAGSLAGIDERCAVTDTVLEIVELAQSDSQKIFEGGIVLLAEDNIANQMVAELQLNELGLSTQVVNNGKEAVQAAATSNKYRAILMDCQMPEMDGFEATRQIRRQEVLTGRRVPIIAMTAHAMQGDRDACVAAGMDDYVTKPVELEELRRVLGCWLTFHDKTKQSTETAQTQVAEGQAIEPAIDIPGLESMFGLKAVRKLVKIFKVETEQSMTKLESALECRDEETIQAVAHRLRGSCATMRARTMATLSSQLELNARSQNWEDLSKWGDELKVEHACVQKEVDAFINQNA